MDEKNATLSKVRDLKEKKRNRKQKEGETLPKDTLRVESMSAEKVYQKLREKVKNITEDIIKGEAPSWNIPSRSDDNVFYDKVSDTVLMGKKHKKRKFLSIRSSKKFSMTSRVLGIISKLLKQKIHATKREVYYNDVKLFEEQRDSDKILEDVAAFLQVARNSLNVVASAKGSVVGRLTFKEGGDEINCRKMGNGGKAITPMIDTISDIESDAEFILVIEKDAAFLRLSEDQFYDEYPSILVTGKGFPDLATRMFLKKIVKELELPVLSLVDSDAYGVHIQLIYAVGSKSMSYQTPFLTVPEIKWLGVRPSDLDKYDLPRSVRLPMNETDIKRAENLLEEEFIQERPEYKKELDLMLDRGEKAEIQALASKGFRFLSEEYLPSKLETGDWI